MAVVALLPRFLFQQEIDHGLLEAVFANSMDSRVSYHVLWPLQKDDNPTRMLFVD